MKIRRIVQIGGSILTALVFASVSQATSSSVAYTYDALGRLKTATYKDDQQVVTQTVTYDYDAAGNRTSHTVTGTGLASEANNGGVVVLPISGFIVLPLPGSVVGE